MPLSSRWRCRIRRSPSQVFQKGINPLGRHEPANQATKHCLGLFGRLHQARLLSLGTPAPGKTR